LKKTTFKLNLKYKEALIKHIQAAWQLVINPRLDMPNPVRLAPFVLKLLQIK